MFLSLGDDGPATAIRFCRFFANVDFDGVEERGKRVEISERHGDFLIGLDPAQRNLQINPEWGLIVTRRGSYTFVKTRSEEHTSELQSLMRTSYAVFCLKKQKQQEQPQTKYTKDQQSTQNRHI